MTTATTWQERHEQAFISPQPGFEQAFKHLVQFLDQYDRAHTTRFDSAIANDYVLGDAYKDILKAARTLLNGEHGRFDAGTMDSIFLGIATTAGFSEDEL